MNLKQLKALRIAASALDEKIFGKEHTDPSRYVDCNLYLRDYLNALDEIKAILNSPKTSKDASKATISSEALPKHSPNVRVIKTTKSHE